MRLPANSWYWRVSLAAFALLFGGATAVQAAADAAAKPLRIVLLKEQTMPSRGLGVDLETLLRNRPDVLLAVVDSAAIVANGIQGDVFCNANGEAYPIDIETRLFEFLQQGGGLLHIGGAPFETAMKQEGGAWTEVVRTFAERHAPKTLETAGPKQEPFDLFRSRLGVATYAPPYGSMSGEKPVQQFDPALVGSLQSDATASSVGVTVCSTLPMHSADPDYLGRYSTAYLAKPTCRQMHAAGWVAGVGNTPILTSLALVKAWGNPLRQDQSVPLRPWAIFTGAADDGLPDGLLDAMIRWLACPVFLRPIELPLATSRRGETVEATSQLVGRLPEGWCIRGRRAELALDEFRAGKPIAWRDAGAEMRDGSVAAKLADDADAFLLPIQFEIVDAEGRVRDYTESAVVPWRPERLTAGPSIKVDGRYLDYRCSDRAADASFLIGANWQDSVQYGFTWHNPNGLRIAGDARKMAASGMKMVRTHYMMPGWMRTVPGQIYESSLPGVYDQFELGPEMTERHLRALEAHVMVFNALGIVFQPTVFTLPPPQMGDPSFWISNARLASCPGLIESQKRFARQIIERFAGVPGITWDLVNEPNDDMCRFGQWLSEMKPLWSATGQLVGIGTCAFLDNVRLGESADWHSLHANTAAMINGLYSGKPHLVQEAWMPTPTTPEGEADLSREMSLGVAIALRERGAGFLPWNWNQFYANWRYGGSFVEFWDNDLGACVHADTTPRAGGVILRNWAALLDGVSFDQQADRQVAFVYPKTFYSGTGTAEYLHTLYRENIPFHAVNDADFAASDLTGVKLVILPNTARGYREATWKRLQEFVHAGGAVVAHNDALLLDEDGRMADGRDVPLREGRQARGDGAFYWTMGWIPMQTDVILGNLTRLFKDLNLDRCKPHALALKDGGEMRFRDAVRQNRTTLKHDWFPCASVPDRLEPIAVEIVDGQGRLVRGWASEGQSLECDGRRFSSTDQFFLVRKGPGRYVLAGGKLTIAGCAGVTSVTLIDPISGRTFDDRPVWQVAGSDLTIELAGSQRLMAVEVCLE